MRKKNKIKFKSLYILYFIIMAPNNKFNNVYKNENLYSLLLIFVIYFII